jgi:hypothetical protein
MTAEVLCGVGIFGGQEGHGEVDAAEANCGPHGPETAGGEAVETAVLDLGYETMAAGSASAIERQQAEAGELARLRQDNKRLKEEVEVLRKASAFFAQWASKT